MGGNSKEVKALVAVLAVKVNEASVSIGEECSMNAVASLARQTESPESVVLVKALASKLKPAVKSNLKDLPERVGGLADSWLIKSQEGRELLCAAAVSQAKKNGKTVK